MKQGNVAACLVAIGCCGIAHGDFSGPYAPENWTFTSGVGGGVLLEHTADTLVFEGGDSGFGTDTDVTIAAVASGMWAFDWSFTYIDGNPGFDNAYYLINGTAHFLSSGTIWGSDRGTVTVPIDAGDEIGFRIETVDGIFGPGVLTITDFSAPVPAPAASLLLPGFGLRPSRQRQGDSA